MWVAAVAAVVVGFAAFWSNPNRRINLTFFTASLHVALWLGSLHYAVFSPPGEGQWWVRVTSAVGAFLPAHLWVMKESIPLSSDPWRKLLRGIWPWVLVCAVLACLTPIEGFVARDSSRESHGFGWAYYTYIVGIIGVYVALSRQTLRQSREQGGGIRLELQIALIGGSISAGSVLLLMALRAILALPWLIFLQPLVVLVFYTASVVAMTTSRIFDARQLLLVAVQRITLIGLVAGFAFATDYVLELLSMPSLLAWVVTTALTLWFARALNSLLDRLFHFYPEATTARRAAYEVARRETQVETLETAFRSVLKGWGQSDHALLIAGTREQLRGSGIELSGEDVVVQTMRQLRWVTPERLARERATPQREAVAHFLKMHALGVLVVGEGPTLTALVGVGVAASRRPFTYPQVTQLMELASIMESAMERAYFSVKVQHAEQLATVGLLGASLAHEIRNPLVSIKTFVQLLPTHHQDPAFRTKFFKLIGDEVNRIDRLTEQLLDLASPRAYMAEEVALHPMLHASLDLVAAKAADKNIQFFTDFLASPDTAWTDASAAKQVMLNLCFNAIQAIESREGERWLRISTRNLPDGVEMAVADSGPGIADEIRPKLFQPFQTTKSTGFGLGLAICSDILANLNATISVDPSAPGHGATFRVIFPCQPLSS